MIYHSGRFVFGKIKKAQLKRFFSSTTARIFINKTPFNLFAYLAIFWEDMNNMPQIQKQNIGNAGEYYIAARLSAKNFIATITLGRAEKYDILALSPTGKLFKLSIKTKRLENTHDFTLSEKDEKGQAKDFYYAFVRLNEFGKEPDFWIIPSRVVCNLIKNAHTKWKKIPGRNNKVHGNSDVRILPIELRGAQNIYYPKLWPKKVKNYYKNLDQLS